MVGALGLDKPAYLSAVTESLFTSPYDTAIFSPNVLLALIKSTSFLHKPVCLFLSLLKEVRS